MWLCESGTVLLSALKLASCKLLKSDSVWGSFSMKIKKTTSPVPLIYFSAKFTVSFGAAAVSWGFGKSCIPDERTRGILQMGQCRNIAARIFPTGFADLLH